MVRILCNIDDEYLYPTAHKTVQRSVPGWGIVYAQHDPSARTPGLRSRAGPRFAGKRAQFGTWSEDGNRRPSFADQQLASENDNCLEDSACALFAFLLVPVGGCETRSPKRSRLRAKPSRLEKKGVLECAALNPKRVWVGAKWVAAKP